MLWKNMKLGVQLGMGLNGGIQDAANLADKLVEICFTASRIGCSIFTIFSGAVDRGQKRIEESFRHAAGKISSSTAGLPTIPCAPVKFYCGRRSSPASRVLTR
jgi:hypothetical protein